MSELASPPNTPRPRHHQPVKIHSLQTHGSFVSTTSSGPKTAPVQSSYSTPYSFHHPTRSSTSIANTPSIARSRADSTAARLAMETMVQARLDALTARLDEFNYQSHELYAKTQALAAGFQAKSKRLYQVEDHLLRLQGKPGLLDENGPRPRRLTNDLEELRMGVKTLRKKFQVAGSVVATAGWWRHLQDERSKLAGSKTEEGPSETPSTAASRMNASAKKDRRSLKSILTDPSASEENRSSLSPSSPVERLGTFSLASASSPEQAMVERAHPALGLRSPPLTPKGPLSGSSLLQGLGLEGKNAGGGLPMIPDHQEDEPTIVMMTHTSDEGSVKPPISFPLIDDAVLEKLGPRGNSTSSSSSSANEEESDLPRPAFLNVFTPPSPFSAAAVAVDVSQQEKAKAESEEEWEAVEEEEEGDALDTPPTATTASTGSLIESIQALSDGESPPSPELSAKTLAQTSPSFSEESASLTTLEENDQEQSQGASQPSPPAFAAVLEEQESSQDQEINRQEQEPHPSDGTKDMEEEMADSTPLPEPDTWIHAFWRLLVRAEYFLLGTAVLGAMMPDNIYAVCAGFLSAVVYAAMLVYHRIAAPAGREAPRPPTLKNSRSKKRSIGASSSTSTLSSSSSSSGARRHVTTVSPRSS